MIRRPPRSTPLYSSAASDVYKRQLRLTVELDDGPIALEQVEQDALLHSHIHVLVGVPRFQPGESAAAFVVPARTPFARKEGEEDRRVLAVVDAVLEIAVRRRRGAQRVPEPVHAVARP